MSEAIFTRGDLVLRVDHEHPRAEGEGIILQHELAYGAEASISAGQSAVVLSSIFPIGHPHGSVEIGGGIFTHQPGPVQLVRPGEENRLWEDVATK